MVDRAFHSGWAGPGAHAPLPVRHGCAATLQSGLVSVVATSVANIVWAIGAAGSALPSHGRGRGFKSRIAHQAKPSVNGIFFAHVLLFGREMGLKKRRKNTKYTEPCFVRLFAFAYSPKNAQINTGLVACFDGGPLPRTGSLGRGRARPQAAAQALPDGFVGHLCSWRYTRLRRRAEPPGERGRDAGRVQNSQSSESEVTFRIGGRRRHLKLGWS